MLSPLFLKIRAISFSLILCISLLWITLLCVFVYLQWDSTDSHERVLVVLMLITHSLTMITLLVLLIIPFHPWLDGARMFFLVVTHACIAGAFAFWNPKLQCPTSTPDSQGLCLLLNMYILIASWIVPVLLLVYSSGLALAVYRSRRGENEPVMMERDSILPIMPPRQSSNLSVSSAEEKRRHISGLMLPRHISVDGSIPERPTFSKTNSLTKLHPSALSV
ncbi:hypothetical protein FB45DRAFT_912630 [Roridomyces roridus]|uniref:Uncharacterized protein n=1 Tax=Roridomyces roridus TaxID=1738132 RepID=A0AAD7BW78_9AGAR|nr:hypothetical protein FB45DRAFT_912630 [Roridomyces roridus]